MRAFTTAQAGRWQGFEIETTDSMSVLSTDSRDLRFMLGFWEGMER